MNHKKCTKCKQSKSLENFKKAKERMDGRSSWCKKCHSRITSESTMGNREKANINNKKYKKTDKGKIANRMYKAKKRARIYELTVKLTAGQNNEVRSIYAKAKNMRSNGENVEVDHIIPLSRGGVHTPENLQILPALENRRKNNSLHFELVDN